MTSIITEKTVQNIIGRRKREIHKGNCGRILIAAGSPGMAGAAILAARSALRAGSGLVRTAIPAELFPIVQVGVPEATCMRRSLPIQNLAAYDAVCVGPGLGEEEESIDFVKEILQVYEKTLIVDADGLNIIAHQNLFPLLHRRAELYPERTILTPHMGEARRLLAAEDSACAAAPAAPAISAASGAGSAASAASGVGTSGTDFANPPAPGTAPSPTPRAESQIEGNADIGNGVARIDEQRTATALPAAPEPDAFDFSASASASARERIADALVQKTRAVIVLKGAGTIVAAEGRQTYTNTTGNPGMATGGSGDVLSGIITSLAGQRSQLGAGIAPEIPIGQTNQTGNATQALEPGTEPASDQTAAPGTEVSAVQALEVGATCAHPKPAHIGAFDAALAGVYIHGLAGDLAARELGEYGVTAGDLALYTAYAIKNILNAK